MNWVQEESPADNYGLILWDHGREDAEFCWDITTDPDWGAYIRVSEVSDLLKKKNNIPIVIFNACLFSSELVVTQMAGSTDVIVVSEPTSYGETITCNYNMFFRTITPDMTPQEMAAIMVRNVGPQHSYPGDPTMLTSIDVTGPRLAETLDALAEAVAAADNDADTAEQLADGMVTLWFLSGSMENWDAETLTYSDGENSVTVSGVSADQVTLNFGQEAPFFVSLYGLGAFTEFVSKKIFEDTDNGFLASV